MEYKLLNKLKDLEYRAHVHAFTPLGTFLWENFLIQKITYEEKYNKKYINRF